MSKQTDKLLALARKIAIAEALKLKSRLVTADHVQRKLIDLGYKPEQLGNLAGSIFDSDDFQEMKGTINSKRKTNRSRILRIWRYIGPRRPL